MIRPSEIAIRKIAASDMDGIAEAGRTPDIRRLPWFGDAFEDSWAAAWVQRARTEWEQGRNRVFAVVDPDDRYIGTVNAGPLRGGEVEVSYWVLPFARGRGVATSAVRLAVAWLRTRDPDVVVWAKAEAENLPSRAVLAAAGFIETDRRSGRFELT